MDDQTRMMVASLMQGPEGPAANVDLDAWAANKEFQTSPPHIRRPLIPEIDPPTSIELENRSILSPKNDNEWLPDFNGFQGIPGDVAPYHWLRRT
jgi:hypothetical protein